MTLHAIRKPLFTKAFTSNIPFSQNTSFTCVIVHEKALDKYLYSKERSYARSIKENMNICPEAIKY